MSGTELTAVGARLDVLEARVGESVNSPLLPFLADYSNQLGNSLGGNDRIAPLMRKLEELETFLHPLFGEQESLSPAVRLSLVESQLSNIQESQAQLEEVGRLEEQLDPASLARIQELQPRVKELQHIQLEQRQHGEQVSQRATELVQRYNAIMTSLNDTFLQADSIISQAEEDLIKVEPDA